MYISDAINFQMTDYVKGYDSKSLDSANNKIAFARKATPAQLHYLFRSYIRKCAGGYSVGWVLK